MFGNIYKITNLQNNKCYIGQTIQNPEKYIERHFKRALWSKENKHLYRAIKKYGREFFQWKILGSCDSKKELDNSEKECISFFNSMNDIYGYNKTPGGDGVQFWTKEMRDKISKANKGNHSPNKGKKLPSKYKGMTYEEIYGIDKAEEIKNNQRKPFSEERKQQVYYHRLGQFNNRFGIKQSKETIQKRIQTKRENNTLKHSEETKEKLKNKNWKVIGNKYICLDYNLIVELFFKRYSQPKIIKEYIKIKNLSVDYIPLRRALKELILPIYSIRKRVRDNEFFYLLQNKTKYLKLAEQLYKDNLKYINLKQR